MSTAASPSPPVPLVPERRTSPTESYIQLSLQSSLPLADPTTSRKLLVLDLNGTLLLRSAHISRGAARTVYPRPYLPSFRNYIFHPTTLQWLDTMVWSSAQPVNVEDMLDKGFGTYKERFKAIWARDTFGLGYDAYLKKTQITRDLARPWEQIPTLISTHPNSEVDAALTTISMDDSPLGAVLQPWNHLCVSQYGKERRDLDVQIAEREKLKQQGSTREFTGLLSSKKKAELEDIADALSLDIQGNRKDLIARISVYFNDFPRFKEDPRFCGLFERARGRKKALPTVHDENTHCLGKEEIGRAEEEEESFDELLLAVIGILDVLKHEGNVAGWMRSGGLVHAGGDRETISETPETETPVITTTAEAMSSTPTSGDKGSVSTPTPPYLWYEIPYVLSHWAQLGRKALAELGIDIIHGVAPVPEKPSSSPTDSYVQLSLRSSLPLADPTTSRKLLVLDLSGTLLLRGAHIGSDAARSEYPRPYLPSFLAYISTLQWLDTMVWSSVQPGNVNYMVDKCFGTYKEGLKAVWARDTLGLSNDEYYEQKKVTKDLAKPWAQIPSLVDADSLRSVPQQQHSALTTILMNHLPSEAVLQPWNYLCVSKYVKERRELDVQIARREKLLLAKKQELEVQGKEEIERAEEESFDELLLAVIGIQDALKHEGNVAGWMRSGGLVHVRGDRETISETETPVITTTTEAVSSTPTSGDKGSVSMPTPIQSPFLWYEIPSVLSHWAQLGRKALAELGIDIIHGVAPVPSSSTESYMQLSLQSSLPLADPTASRKLLVLDLSGTLFLHVYSGVGIPRTLYARPYLPSFLAYIFHPTTLQWLDTMVWSSLERRNTDGMVDECFGTYREGLKAVWARDTFRLSKDEYCKKTQITKDLARPWAEIPSLISNQSPPHRPENPNSEVDADRDGLSSVPQQHSVLSTILMDNIPLNAVLQPWNHLRVPKYGKERFQLGVQIAERELGRKQLPLERTWQVTSKLEIGARQLDTMLERMRAKDKQAEERTTRAELEITEAERMRGKKIQETQLLLAVIGILDTLKHERNVAGWMMSGRLPPLWYEIPSILSHWAQRGRKALAELEIDAVHGNSAHDPTLGGGRGVRKTFNLIFSNPYDNESKSL